MKTHIQVVAALHIALGALSVIGAMVLFACLGLAGTIVVSQGEQAAAGILGIIAVVLSGFLVLLGLPIGGCAYCSILTLKNPRCPTGESGIGLATGRSVHGPLALDEY